MIKDDSIQMVPMLNNDMVDSTIKQLRREAYRMWGLKPKLVVYNMPTKKLKVGHKFVFKINYDSAYREWPKSYTLIVPKVCSLERIIMPIVVIDESIQLRYNAWYDMPVQLNEQLISLLKGEPFKKNMSLWKKVYNTLTPKGVHYTDSVDLEDYTFCVSRGSNSRLEAKLI